GESLDQRIVEIPDPFRFADIFAAMFVLFIQQADGVRVVLKRREGVLDQLLHRHEWIARTHRQIALLIPKNLVHPLERGDEQSFFGLEVVVQHVLADIAAFGDAVDTRAFKADTAKFVDGQLKNLLADASRIAATTRQNALLLSTKRERNASSLI